MLAYVHSCSSCYLQDVILLNNIYSQKKIIYRKWNYILFIFKFENTSYDHYSPYMFFSWWYKSFILMREKIFGHIHVKMIHSQLLFVTLRNNELANQYDVVKLDWLFLKNIHKVMINEHKTFMNQIDVVLYYNLNPNERHTIFMANYIKWLMGESMLKGVIVNYFVLCYR